jgi:hypothetical protein
MRIVELLSNIQVAITNEQADLLSRFQHEPVIAKHSLNEREQVIMNQLVMQDIVHRSNNGQISYKKKIQ